MDLSGWRCDPRTREGMQGQAQESNSISVGSTRQPRPDCPGHPRSILGPMALILDAGKTCQSLSPPAHPQVSPTLPRRGIQDPTGGRSETKPVDKHRENDYCAL